MTVYASRDHAGGMVCVSPDGHGGCGQAHRYEMVAGYPAITCPQCETYLATDSLHSARVEEVPESHDEREARERAEKHGSANERQMTALALAKLAGVPSAGDALAAMMGSTAPVPLPAVCPQGHPNAGAARFCVTCGSSLAAPAPARCPDGHQSPPGATFCAECGKAIATDKPPSTAAGKTTRTGARAAAKAA